MKKGHSYAYKCAEISGNYFQAIECLYILDLIQKGAESELLKFESQLSKSISGDALVLLNLIKFGKNQQKMLDNTEQIDLAINLGSRSVWKVDIDFTNELSIGESDFHKSNLTNFL